MPVKSLPKLTKLSGFQTLKMTNLQKWNAPVLLEASRFYKNRRKGVVGVKLGSMSPLQLSIYTHMVVKVVDEKYETIGGESSKKIT